MKKIHRNKPSPNNEAAISRAQDLVYDGWELMCQDLREAKKCFDRAVKLDPELADAYNGLGEIAIYRGNARAAGKFRSTIFANPYLIPLVLNEKPEVLPIWHSTNLRQRDYAYEYFDWYGKLWIGKEEAVRFLQFFWEDPEIQEDYEQWVGLWTKLKRLKDVNKRIPVIDLALQIERKKLSAKFLRRLREFIASRGISAPGSAPGVKS